ncbi:acetamidase/formamidase family protein [candidate division KSB1 bacterium]
MRIIFFMAVLGVLFAACNTGKPGFEIPKDAVVHVLNPTPETVVIGHYWSEAPPALRIKSGDVVNVHTLHVFSPRQLERAGVPEDGIEQELRDVHEKVQDRGPGGHVLNGPVYIEGAEPGDMLEVRILSIDLAIPYAYNSIGGNGFLGREIRGSGIKTIPLDAERNVAVFGEGIEIPLAPFFGSMGVAPPADAGRWNSSPPWIHGGNLDNKELVAGTTLFLPVFIKGALFEIGDGHAAQGNGEVDITALETSLKGSLQFIVHKGKTLEWPRAETPDYYISMGTNEDLTEAAKIALREMIGFLVTEKGMTQQDAYALCSCAVDFNITQVVDGNKGVHGMLPKKVFTTQTR